MTPPRLRARGRALGLVLTLALASAAAARGDLSVELLAGLEQNRNFERDGQWQRQWVRSLPPQGGIYLQVVHGPESWLEQAGRQLSPGELAAANQPHVATLLAAARQAGLLTGGPELQAAQLVALVRPVATDDQPSVSRYQRIWQLWEVLADAGQADTLSASFAALQGLESLGIAARLARYPSAGGTAAFGILLPGQPSPSVVQGAYPVEEGTLLPLVLAAAPAGVLPAADLRTWSWAEVLAPGWEPGLPGQPEMPHRGVDGQLLDPCAQARALGFDCVDPAARTQGWEFYALSGLVLLALLGWAFGVWRARRRRLRRAEEFRKQRLERGF